MRALVRVELSLRLVVLPHVVIAELAAAVSALLLRAVPVDLIHMRSELDETRRANFVGIQINSFILLLTLAGTWSGNARR